MAIDPLAPAAGNAPGFGELVGLMVWGTGSPDAYRGVVRRVEPGEDGRPGEERRYRLARRGRLVRAEDLSGRVLRIAGDGASWFREPESDVMRVRVDAHRRYADYAHQHLGGLSVGGPRPSWERWTGTDFTRPAGPVSETEFLGRRAWTVELAPPSHKPFPLRIVVDAKTGLVLRTANAGLGSVEEWVEFELDPELPDGLFSWDGPTQPVASRDDHEASRLAEEAERKEWLAQRGLAALPLALECEVWPHEYDESGHLYASIHVDGSATLIRRPRSEDEWSEPATTNYPHSWRWSDELWDWFLAADRPLTEQNLAVIRARLAAST